MGKSQKKTGKGRLDKYYKLAKEQGYRARSAFKLIQLNKKYSFLEGARCCIDLCAAPGGWLQVASKYMPPNSLIVGVDLVPIRPIPRVATFASDITTPQCRQQLRGELKDWKADVVLHDGAPNVGTAWIQDAYTQSELVLMSLKLAVEFLAKGGTFVTKVFRSVDYNNLVWVFSQLFGKVEATKPPSSRNVSAEIFVVCRDFLAPKHIDPKFLDPRHVFKDLSASAAGAGVDKGTSAGNVQMNVFQPEKNRRRRDGYAEGDYTLHHRVPVADFVKSVDPIAVLGTCNQMTFTTDEEKGWLDLEITRADVKANCDDLKVLGKGDFKTLLKWRAALREEIGLDVKRTAGEDHTETVEVTEEVDEEEQIQNELERLNSEAAARSKRQRRHANEQKQRTIQRMQLRMVAPLDIGLEQADAQLGVGQDDVFDLGEAERGLRRAGGARQLADAELPDGDDGEAAAPAHAEEEDEEGLDSEEERERRLQGLEGELDGLYDAYRTKLAERDAKFRVKEARKKNALRSEEWGGVKGKGSDDDGSDGDSDAETDGEGGWDVVARRKAAEGEDSSDDDSDAEPVLPRKRRRLANGKALETGLVTSLEAPKPKAESSRAAQLWFSQDVFAGVPALDELEDEDDEDESQSSMEEDEQVPQSDADDASDDDFEVVPQEPDDDVDMWDVAGEDEDAIRQRKIRDHGLLTAEAVTLAQQLVNREKTKTELLNEGFNRYALNSKEGLPAWFLDEEAQHYKPNVPITKEAVSALRAKQRALDARPIKKIAEAKARKKYKAAQRLEKAMKKAQGVNDSADITEREKASQIEKLMRKGAAGAAKRKEIKVVVAKGSHKGIQGRPKGVKGRYQMVDPRMRKETRAKKRKEKANKKRKRT